MCPAGKWFFLSLTGERRRMSFRSEFRATGGLEFVELRFPRALRRHSPQASGPTSTNSRPPVARIQIETNATDVHSVQRQENHCRSGHMRLGVSRGVPPIWIFMLAPVAVRPLSVTAALQKH